MLSIGNGSLAKSDYLFCSEVANVVLQTVVSMPSFRVGVVVFGAGSDGTAGGQRKARKAGEGPCEKQRRTLGLSGWEQRRLTGDLIALYVSECQRSARILSSLLFHPFLHQPVLQREGLFPSLCPL